VPLRTHVCLAFVGFVGELFASYTIYISVVFGPPERKIDFTVFQIDNIYAVIIAFPLATFI